MLLLQTSKEVVNAFSHLGKIVVVNMSSINVLCSSITCKY